MVTSKNVSCEECPAEFAPNAERSRCVALVGGELVEDEQYQLHCVNSFQTLEFAVPHSSDVISGWEHLFLDASTTVSECYQFCQNAAATRAHTTRATA